MRDSGGFVKGGFRTLAGKSARLHSE